MTKWFLLALALILLYVAMKAADWHSTPLVLPSGGMTLTLAPGDSISSVAKKLAADGALSQPTILKFYARFVRSSTQVRTGEYRVESGTTPPQLLDLLASGKVIEYRVTFPEGFTLEQFIAKLGVQGKLGASGEIVRSELIVGYANPEGWFFPDTYSYQAGAKGSDILALAGIKMQAVLQEEWVGRDAELPYANPYEALIMASIIERETARADERELIAGVFVRRLRLGMRLQTDPTVIYGLGHEFDGNLTRTHLRDERNPYNTYRKDGLPPTPIASPGRDSIRAALHPSHSQALYFVARGDGSHYFSNTLLEHEAAVRKYQLGRG